MRNFVFLVFLLCLVKGLSGETIHEVRKNETLGGIARKYGISTSALQAYNGIKNPNLLFVGKKLKIPNNSSKEIIYEVRKGDSLGGIAKRFGANPSSLALINKIERPDLIRIGQKLIIPLTKTAPPPPAPSLIPAGTLSLLKRTRVKTGKWERIVIHHSATPVDDAMNMDRVHKARGMKNGLAYHFVISNGSRKAYDGEIVMGNRWKNQLDGGHMKKLTHNKTSIGICLIGNFELRSPTSKQMNALEGLCEYLMKRCKIKSSEVTTHKGLHPGHTVCPGKFFSLPTFRKRISS